jgi:hypothetical protein
MGYIDPWQTRTPMADQKATSYWELSLAATANLW